ncbi:MAG TPA: hypothetical protein VJB15_12200 [Rhodothermia bacterium]|nr:hypothetical protein [Rhodothermia bacterium]
MIRRTVSVLIVFVGIFFIVYGGYDDSPGGQGLGLLLVMYGMARLFIGKKIWPEHETRP